MIKLLLDENLPVRLKDHFPPEIKVYSVYDMSWSSLKNGDLLKAITDNGFSGLITSDQNLIYQQNINKFNIIFFIIKAKDNRFVTVLPLIRKIVLSLNSGDEDKVRLIK